MADKEESVAAPVGDKETMLLFQCGVGGRMAMDLSLVARLEEFKPEMIEKAGRYEVVQYRGQIMPLIRVSEFVNVECSRTTDPAEMMQVVVFSEHGRSVGLVVDRILDIAEETIVRQQPTKRDGLLGSAVIQERVTDLLDVRGLVRTANPDFFDCKTEV